MAFGGKKWLIIGIVVLLIVIIPILIFKSSYNNLVALDEDTKGKWADVETQLQRRYDLIPNLVQTVKGFAAQEKEVLTQVTEARAKVGGASSVPQQIEANNQLTSALSRLLVVVERYPDLKSNQNFLRLQDELAGTENRVAVSRRRYNESIQGYNATIRRFPTFILAGMLNFDEKPYFEAPEAAETAPQVSF